MTDLDRALTEVFSDLADEAPHDPGLARRVRQRAGRRGAVTVAASAAAFAAAVTGVVVLEHGRGGSTSPTVATAPAPACDGTPRMAVVPDWARAGFSNPEPVAPLVTSRSGNVVAILFGKQLWSPPRKDVSNKVLWVWRQALGSGGSSGGGGGEITMTAQLVGTDRVVTTGLPPPVGPSTVDLPLPGCWRITLHAPGGTDTIDLDYARP
jgi:hypothetical protein